MHTRTRRENLIAGGSSLVLGLGLLTGCARGPLEAKIPAQVEDRTTARELPGDIIVNEVAGVRVEASVADWGGDNDIFEHVTPVRVEIINDSGAELRVSYQDIELQAADGTTYAALPLYRIDGPATKPVVTADWDYAPTSPKGFYVAPHAAPLYEGEYTIYDGEFEYDPGYYTTYYRYWANVPLPTAYMVEQALPEGVMPHRGRMIGWVYFERVPEADELEPVYLSISLAKAEDGTRIGRVRLPFSVDD